MYTQRCGLRNRCKTGVMGTSGDPRLLLQFLESNEMTTSKSLKLIKKAHEEIRKDPVRLKKLMVSIGAYDIHRKIEGQERENLVFLFQMMEPTETSNNQHSWTDTYHIGKRVYHAHYFPGADEALIEEYIKYKDD